MPNTVIFDPSSEEGEILIRWGFRPQVLGYLPNIRGVVTGVPAPPSRPPRVRIVGARSIVALRPKAATGVPRPGE
jgi:hypothetical protein